MTVIYRGHRITASRVASLNWPTVIAWKVVRIADQYDCDDGVSVDDWCAKDCVDRMKAVVDSELSKPDPWDEAAWKTFEALDHIPDR